MQGLESWNQFLKTSNYPKTCHTNFPGAQNVSFSTLNSLCEVAQSCPTLCDPMKPTRLLRPWDFPGKSTGVGCHFLLQGLFMTQGSNPGFLHCRQIFYHLSHEGSPINQPTTVFLPAEFHGQRRAWRLQSMAWQTVRHDWATTHNNNTFLIYLHHLTWCEFLIHSI